MAASGWAKLTPEEKVTAAGIDVMSHPKFALLSGCCVMGALKVEKDLPTAATNGRDEYYGRKFVEAQNRKQMRWTRIHENMHKALHHCTEYRALVEQYGMLCNIAQDFVINAMIDELDPKQAFAQQPVNPDTGAPLEICLDRKYYGWSFPAVLRDLLKNAKLVKLVTDGKMKPFDQHMPGDEDMSPDEQQKLKRDIEDALRQGKILTERLAGKEKGGNPLDALTRERHTNWREHLRIFIAQIIQGWEQSRYCPPNKRLLPHCLMPSHFAESTGELVIACDTSGSMQGVYPVVFGEIVRICQDVKPQAVRVLWWDTAVAGDQRFELKDFDKLTSLMQPAGGGGTTPGVVGKYMAKHKIKARALIVLTDGYIDPSWKEVECDVLWGVLDNPGFVAPQGKTLHLESGAL